jgi:rhamnosyl/mannosyltransferase
LSGYTDKCHIIPYGIPLENFEHCDDVSKKNVRRRFGDRLIVSVGRLVYYKGFEYLLKAMTHVRGSLVIVGDGPLRAKLQQLARELGVHNKVYFVGKVPEAITVYYHAADVFALASIARSEAFGIVQIEAMAAGLPVVNTGLDSGVPSVSVHDHTGITVPPADPDSLAVALNRLLDNRELRQAFGDAGRRRVREEFALEKMTARTLALYEKVAHQA